MTETARPACWTWVASAAVCSLLLALPLLTVQVAPITDLPQQVAQMRLLDEVRAGTTDAYQVQWWHPNKLGYLPLAVGWQIGSHGANPFAAGRWAMVLVALAWVVAIHALAKAWGRPLAAAMLASVFFYNHITYWGFVSFLCGMPVFLAWLGVVSARRPILPSAAGRGVLLAFGGLLLYAAHVLWLVLGIAWLLLDSLVLRRQRRFLVRLLWLAPALALVAAWYPRFAASGFDSETHWGQTLVERLSPGWLVNTALGGLHGSVTTVVATAVLAWILLGCWQHRQRLGDHVDSRLLAAGALLAVLSLLLPGVFRHTIFFASRWLPVAAILLLLGASSPTVRPALRCGLAMLLVAALSLTTVNTWSTFERVELEGLVPAIAAVPPGARLLGLDFVRQSPRIHDYPFYHLYAYAQARGGGTLNRSFADQASSLVVFRDLPKAYPWTHDLDWQAHKVRADDVAHFDHVLAFGARDIHAQLNALGSLEPLTQPAPWRLYRVRPATTDSDTNVDTDFANPTANETNGPGG